MMTRRSDAARFLDVDAGVRYWEDAHCISHPEHKGEDIPGRDGKRWKVRIDLSNGHITPFTPNTVWSVHFKVCDDGSYWLVNEDGERVASREGEHVPDIIGEDGDYIVLGIIDGVITDWHPPEVVGGFMPIPVSPASTDIVDIIADQRRWSRATFGPGPRPAGTIAHIRKELAEIEANPTDVVEWVDVAILALDGAWRAGHSPRAIARALLDKQQRNRDRKWPAVGTVADDKPIEHVG